MTAVPICEGTAIYPPIIDGLCDDPDGGGREWFLRCLIHRPHGDEDLIAPVASSDDVFALALEVDACDRARAEWWIESHVTERRKARSS